MTKEEKELTITYLTKMQEEYIEGEGYERYPLPEYYALDMAIKALEQQSNDCKIFGHKENCFGGATENECNHCDYKIQAPEKPTSEDCVSRADLLKLYEDRFIELQKAHQQDKQLGVNWCINTLKEMPPVTPTQSWIPVSEKLPEVGEKVLCQCQANIYDVLKLTADGWYYDNRHCYMSGFVIAWQPLPKPYEEKRGSKK